jgi:hypothetical protein
MGNAAPLLEFLAPLLYLGQHLEVVEDILKRALIREPIEQRANGLLRLHGRQSSAAASMVWPLGCHSEVNSRMEHDSSQ